MSITDLAFLQALGKKLVVVSSGRGRIQEQLMWENRDLHFGCMICMQIFPRDMPRFVSYFFLLWYQCHVPCRVTSANEMWGESLILTWDNLGARLSKSRSQGHEKESRTEHNSYHRTCHSDSLRFFSWQSLNYTWPLFQAIPSAWCDRAISGTEVFRMSATKLWCARSWRNNVREVLLRRPVVLRRPVRPVCDMLSTLCSKWSPSSQVCITAACFGPQETKKLSRPVGGGFSTSADLEREMLSRWHRGRQDRLFKHFHRLFPTCQVRVVWFYQSFAPPPPPPPPPSSPPPPPPPLVSPRPCLHQLPPPRPPCQLCAKLVANFPAHEDLNLGPSQRSSHRWTPTWDLPSSVRPAGPQRPDRTPEDLPHRMPHRMSEDMPEDMPEHKPEHMPEDMPGRIPEDMPHRLPEDMPDKMPGDMSDRMQEILPVTKRINVMVGITRSKVM